MGQYDDEAEKKQDHEDRGEPKLLAHLQKLPEFAKYTQLAHVAQRLGMIAPEIRSGQSLFRNLGDLWKNQMDVTQRATPPTATRMWRDLNPTPSPCASILFRVFRVHLDRNQGGVVQ